MPIDDETRRLLEALQDPEQIQDALNASSPYVLRKAFDTDPGIRTLVQGGPETAVAIAEILEHRDDLDEISLCAYFYVLEHVGTRDSLSRALGTDMRARLRRPSPLLPQFSTRAILRVQRAPLRGPAEVYSPAEVLEVIGRIH